MEVSGLKDSVCESRVSKQVETVHDAVKGFG